jgi:DNA-binding IclR family transcriptional regulator
MPETAKTADQALRVLEHVAEHGPIGTSEVARSLRMHRTVVHRLLATLQGRGYVRRAEGGWLPGATVLRIARRVEPELLAAARPVLERLAAEHGETAILTIADDDEAVQIDQAVGGEHFVRVELSPGFRHPLGKGASGRALLAFLPLDAIARVVARSADPPALQAALAEVRRTGYATSHDELSAGVQGVSVPVRVGGVAVASLGMVFPSTRGGEASARVAPLVRAAARIGKALYRRA